MSIESLVNDCLIEHEGGEKFFNAIDERLRNDNLLMAMILSRVLQNESFDYLIVSGTFGHVFKDFCIKSFGENIGKVIVTVNGGIRKGNIVGEIDKDFSNKNIVFIDDSFYLGRTRDKIKELVKSKGGNLICSYVFYDGSKNKDENVHSFYRYYDHYKEDEKSK